MRLFRARPTEDAQSSSDSDAIRLLLIDDDEDEYRLLRSAIREIEAPRYDLDWVANADDGLRRMGDGYAAVFVDYRLGATSGIELVRTAREQGHTVPLIMLTGEGSKQVDMAALDAGASDYLEKGRTGNGLLERTLRYAISNFETHEALRRSLRQVTALESLGRLLSEHGPTPEALDEVARLLDEEFGIGRVSLYLMEDSVLHLAAVRGYAYPSTTIDSRSGKLRWLLDAGRAQMVPNMTIDPSERTGNEAFEYCVPLFAEGQALGVLNAVFPEGSATEDMQRIVMVVADRLAVALALNRAIRGRSFLPPSPTPPPSAQNDYRGLS